MFNLKIIALFSLACLIKLSTAAPDSAGIVEMENGLAYGGIPYGSVTGMVAKYRGSAGRQLNYPQARQLSGLNNVGQPVIVTPNFRATRLVGSQPRAVQIYNLPGVVAPGVVGTISQIGY